MLACQGSVEVDVRMLAGRATFEYYGQCEEIANA